MLTIKIQKLIATERIPLVVLIIGGTNPPPGEFVPPSALPIPSLGALSVNPESNP
jgi:hypothetical protein